MKPRIRIPLDCGREVWEVAPDAFVVVVRDPSCRLGADGIAVHTFWAYRCSRVGDIRGLRGELVLGRGGNASELVAGPFLGHEKEAVLRRCADLALQERRKA